MNTKVSRRILSVLLVLLLVMGFSATAFAAEDSGTMKLDTPDASGNAAFFVENMFPGDAETKDFTVKVNHKEPVTLYYHADIRPSYEKLAEVMMVRIELPEKGITLYDGLMRDMPSALEHQLASNETEIIYRITAYLNTSVGNEYQYKSLIADFRWWYEEESGGEEPKPDEPTTPETPDIPDNPKTGDDSNLHVWFIVMISSLVMVCFLLILMKRKKGDEANG